MEQKQAQHSICHCMIYRIWYTLALVNLKQSEMIQSASIAEAYDAKLIVIV